MLFLDMDFFEKAGRWLAAIFCQCIYPIITWLFELFMTVAKVNILSVDDVKPIYQRVTMILTIVMVFYVTFQFVKFVVQPDGITDKEKGTGKIIYKMVLVVVLIAFVPQIFDGAYTIQEKILNSEVISKIIFGSQNANAGSFGKTFSSNVFSMFYRADPMFAEDSEQTIYEAIVATNLERLRENNSLGGITAGLYDVDEYEISGEEITKPRISFNGLIAIGVGAMIVWILIMYCIDLGVRWAQLVFLQIIAPIAIIGYLSPKKDGMFQKWLKQCISTFLDIFLRLAIVYFALLICQILTASFANNKLFENLGNVGDTMKMFIYVVLILGVMLFMKKAPELLKELFPKTSAASGNFGLKGAGRGLGWNNIKKGARGLGRVAGAAAGAAIGAGSGLATGIGQGLRKRHNAQSKGGKVAAGAFGATLGAVRGTVGGAVRGVAQGSKKGNVVKNSLAGAKQQIESNKQYGNRAENGYTLGHQIGDRARSLVGARSRVESLENDKAPIKREQEVYEKVRKANSDMTAEAESQVKKGKGKYSGELAAAEKKLQNMQESQTFRDDVKKEIENSEDYIAQCKAIENDGKDKPKEQLEKEKRDILENMTDNRVAEQLAAAQKRVKSAKDKAVFDFITNGEWNGTEYSGQNAKIESIRSLLGTEITEYNINNEHHQVDAETITNAMQDGELFDALIKGQRKERIDAAGNKVVYDYSKEDANGIKIGINAKIDAQQNKLTEITQRQEAIKREIEGSGINEGSKK